MNHPCDLSQYYHLIRETDGLYMRLQKRSGLSDAEYWCLASVQLEGCRHAHEIGALLHMNRQTISAALRKLVNKGLIQLSPSATSLREKEITLTEKGFLFGKDFIVPLSDIENKAWRSLSGELRRALITATRMFNKHFKDCLSEHGYD